MKQVTRAFHSDGTIHICTDLVVAENMFLGMVVPDLAGVSSRMRMVRLWLGQRTETRS